jgi:hypothetical protein
MEELERKKKKSRSIFVQDDRSIINNSSRAKMGCGSRQTLPPGPANFSNTFSKWSDFI